MSESIKRSTSVGSIIAYGIAIAFFALAIFLACLLVPKNRRLSRAN
jgi:hypothetical protein